MRGPTAAARFGLPTNLFNTLKGTNTPDTGSATVKALNPLSGRVSRDLALDRSWRPIVSEAGAAAQGGHLFVAEFCGAVVSLWMNSFINGFLGRDCRASCGARYCLHILFSRERRKKFQEYAKWMFCHGVWAKPPIPSQR